MVKRYLFRTELPNSEVPNMNLKNQIIYRLYELDANDCVDNDSVLRRRLKQIRNRRRKAFNKILV